MVGGYVCVCGGVTSSTLSLLSRFSVHLHRYPFQALDTLGDWLCYRAGEPGEGLCCTGWCLPRDHDRPQHDGSMRRA